MSKFIWQSSAYVYIYIFIRIFCWFKFFISFSLSIHIGFGDFDFYGTDTHNALYKLFQTHTQSKTSYINHCKALKLVECSRHKETKRWKHDTSYPLSISFWRDSVTKKKKKTWAKKYGRMTVEWKRTQCKHRTPSLRTLNAKDCLFNRPCMLHPCSSLRHPNGSTQKFMFEYMKKRRRYFMII